jgi:tetratricopeptide (TPR) repeat protein
MIISLFVFLPFPGSADANTCEAWVAKAVSVQGSVQARVRGGKQWMPVQLNNTFCTGDMVRVQEQSRAAIVMSNETILRLDQNTTITFTSVEKKADSILDLITGAVHFISRVPRTLKISTPFVNGTIDGTEFLVRVFDDHTLISVFEGRVLAANSEGSLSLASGQSAIAEKGRAPAIRVIVRPRDAVQWALYYPPVLMKQASEGVRDARFYNHRAAQLLSVGRVDQARDNIGQALELAPRNSDSTALQSIIALVQNERDRALELAEKAVQYDRNSAAALIALSYALQAGFDLDGALANIQKAVDLAPGNSLAHARLSELQLSFGNVGAGLESAQKAVELNPRLARTQAVLGFAYLTKIKPRAAMDAFDKAIKLDQADPLPRLGLGLAKIRKGMLKQGRMDIEIAASLDPNYALSRSYLGKAYYEEKRDNLAMSQFDMSKGLDPHDPTPFFYDAIRKQSINRPVEALHDIQRSIELNDNRAVYRSKLLLDEDLAARSAGLARIYHDLGFQQLALVEGWKSVNTDPGNYSAHRFLADSYSSLPRHEIARVSELLQSQLFQPVNITPVQPQLAESGLFILNGAGPGNLSFNEFTPLFNRNRFALQVSGVAGENSTYGDEAVISGMHGGFSLSAGRFHYKTDGFRENNDQEHDIYNVFTQIRLTHQTSVQAEFRYKETEKGDLSLNFDPDNFIPVQRQRDESHSLRLGLHHNVAPHSDIIASFIYKELEEGLEIFPVYGLESDDEGYTGEVQYLYRLKRLKLTTGAGYFDSDTEETQSVLIVIDPFLPPISDVSTEEFDKEHINVYIYSLINYPDAMTWTLGGSYDDFEGFPRDQNQFNPKFGLTWNPLPKTTMRAAVFRTLERSLISSQTIEPTQVAGFNKFFHISPATDTWHYGAALDQKFTDDLYGGIEYTRREIEIPFRLITTPMPPAPPIPVSEIIEADWEEDGVRAYLYWTPRAWMAVRGEYSYERFERDSEFGGPEDIITLETHKVPLGVSVHHALGLSAGVKATYVHQRGEFIDAMFQTTSKESDRFWVVDASIGYRLPKRLGIISVEAKNVFDEDFRFQDTDPANPDIYPERLILGKITLAF